MLFGTDSEKNLHNSISSVFTSGMHLLCDLHMKDNIKFKLVEWQIANENRQVIFGKIVRNVKEEGLCDCINIDDFEVCHNGLKTKWINMDPAEEQFVSSELRSMVGLGFLPKPYTQNGNECINSIIKQGKKERYKEEEFKMIKVLLSAKEMRPLINVTLEDSGLLYSSYSILVEIFKETDELLSDGIGYESPARGCLF